MNDYFSNLLSRSLGRTGDISLVSPRLPSLFESSHDLWGESVEMSSRPSLNHRLSNEPLSPSSAEGRKEPTNLERSPERYVGVDIGSPMKSEDSLSFHQSSMEILTATPESSPRDQEPGDTSQTGQSLRVVIKLPASPAPSDNKPIEQLVRNQTQGEATTEDTNPTATRRTVPRPDGEGGPFLAKVRQEEPSIRLPTSSRKEHSVAEDVRLKERVEHIFERGTSSVSEVGKSQKIIMPSIKQLPPRHVVESISPPLQKYGQRETPAKPEPTIQVTIGRIEVRAVTQGVAKRPRPKGAAPMSLDDYLQRRSGGG